MSHFNTMFSGLKPKGRKALALLLSLLMITSTAAPAFADLFAFLDVEEPQQEQTAEQAQYSAGVLETVGDTYRVTVSYEAEAEIPEDAQLEVSEILPGEAEYDAYYKASMDKLRIDEAGFVRLFDISILYGGEKIQPKDDTKVKIYCSEFDDVEDMSELFVLHFKDLDVEEASPINPGDGVGGGEGFRSAPEVPEEAKGVSLELEKNIAAFEDEFAGLTAVGKGEDASIAEAEMADAEQLEAEIMDGSLIADDYLGKVIEFTTNGFSVYAIVESNDIPQPPRVTFVFKDPNNPDFYFIDKAGNEQTTQILKDGEVLQDVGLPTIPEGETFQGWYLYNGSTSVGQIEFGSPFTIAYGEAGNGSTITPNSITIDPNELDDDDTFHVNVKAYFGEVVYLTFYEDAAGTNILHKIQLPKGDEYDISQITVTSPESELAFLGWSESAGTNDDDRTPITDTNITFDEDDTFYPIFKSGYWITFYAGATGSGATYTAPAFVIAGQTAASAQPSNPTWKGYTFQYWTETNIYTGTNGSYVQPSSAPARFNFNSTLNSPTTLYAYWTPAQTTYTVVFWQQNLNDSKTATNDEKTYSFAEQITENGTTGTTVNASNYSGRYTGFSLNTNKSDTSVEVKADGTSVINIYFDRNLITMNFDQDIPYYTETTATTGTQYGYVDGQYVQITYNGTNWVYTTTEPVYTNYTGTRYNTTTSNDGTQYGVYNNQVVRVYRHYQSGWGGYDHWSRRQTHQTGWGADDQQYNGTRYVENANGSYGFANGSMVELNDNGQYQSGTQNVTHVYEGTRYTRGTTRSFTGLYGQTLAQNGYSWPSQYIWTYGTNTIMSYLGQFVLPNASDTTISFRSGGIAAKTVYFYLQNVDGTYPETPSASGSATSNATTFNVSNKYDGFEVDSYQIGNNGNGTTGTWTSTSAGSSISIGNSNLGVRYRRKHFTLKYLDSVDSTELRGISNADVVYGATLTNYKPGSDFTPQSQYPGKVWDGKWYKDQACTDEFDWSVTMPNADMVVYAGWENVYYKVDIDPNGGVLTSSESTFTWLTYGQSIQRYDDVVRDYVEDPNGTLKYESWLRSVYTDAGYDPWDYSGYPRTAGYVSIDTNSTAEMIQYGGTEVEGTVAYTYDSTRYKYEKGAYALIGWYEIQFEEGHYGDMAYKTGETLYTFGTGVTHDTYIQAKWRRVGLYYVDYLDECVYLMNEDGSITQTDCNYDTSGSPVDPYSYADQSESAILSAPDSPKMWPEGSPEGKQYVFQGWWYDGQLYMPGDIFTIKSSLAVDKVVGQDSTTGDDIIHKTIEIIPVYQVVDNLPVDVTHIYWYSNWKDTNGDQISNLTIDTQYKDETDNELQPNEAVSIRKITEIPSFDESKYSGYTFKGWARVPIDVDVTSTAFNADDYMYLYWDGTDFHVNSEDGTKVTEVAADENTPYHDMYAVWEINTYTVTVTKTVVGSAEDQRLPFTFVPSFEKYSQTLYSNFNLTGEAYSYTDPDTGETFNYNTEKVFLDVPYGDTLTLREEAGDYFTVTVTSTQTTDADGKAIQNAQPVESTNPGTYTIQGDVTIAYTNTRKTSDVTIIKNLVNPYIDNTNGVDFYFTADWGQDNPETITVNSNDSDGVTIEDVPAGLEMVITETIDTSYEYSITANGNITTDTDSVANTYTFTVTAENETVTFTNTVVTVDDVNVNKIDKDTKEGLSGAQFTLTRNRKLDGSDSNYDLISGFSNTLTSGQNGILIDAATLPVGTYKLTEKKAPNGYIIASNEVIFSIAEGDDGKLITLVSGDAIVSEDGKTLSVNNTAGQALPNTGSTQAILFTAFGVVTALAAGAVIYKREKKED